MKPDTFLRTLELGWGLGTVAGVAIVSLLTILIAWGGVVFFITYAVDVVRRKMAEKRRGKSG